MKHSLILMSLLIVNFSKATRGIALAMPSFCISYLDMSLTFLSYYGAVEKNGSFGFAKGRLVCRAKPNVPFVRLAKIVFKKCAVGKNKNTEALAFGSAV
ncbi:MAG TPA: hypothetical protein PKN63_09415 [Chitinophagales bacterium]|nr:hypothetical protein [Chitinophagales bacterium]